MHIERRNISYTSWLKCFGNCWHGTDIFEAQDCLSIGPWVNITKLLMSRAVWIDQGFHQRPDVELERAFHARAQCTAIVSPLNSSMRPPFNRITTAEFMEHYGMPGIVLSKFHAWIPFFFPKFLYNSCSYPHFINELTESGGVNASVGTQVWQGNAGPGPRSHGWHSVKGLANQLGETPLRNSVTFRL